MRKMKLSFSTVMCMDLGADAVVDLCKRHGLDGVEIRTDGARALKTAPEHVPVLSKKLSENNIAVPIVGSSVCLTDYDAGKLSDARAAVDLAEALGAMGVRIFLGNFAPKTCAPRTAVCHSGIVRALRELCEYGEGHNVAICVETHNEYATGKALASLKEDTARESLKFIWDIMHPIEDKEAIADTWKYIGEDVVHVHIKDGFNRQSPEWHDFYYTPLGHGSIPIRSVLELLEKNGFDGFVSLEWENEWREELRVLQMSADVVLSDFVTFMKKKEDNLIPPVGSGKWTGFVPFEDSGKMNVDSQRTGLEIEVKNGLCPLHRWDASAFVEEGKTYDFSVRVLCDGVRNLQSAYVMLTVNDADGVMLQREYADHAAEGHLYKKLKIHPGGREVKVEMGLKRDGRVVWYEPRLTEGEARPERKVKIASVCYDSYSKENEFKYSMAETIERIGALIDKTAAAEHPDLMLFAETLSTRATTDGYIYEDEEGTYCSMMRQKAREHNCFISFTFCEEREGRRHNTALLIDRNGNTVGRYLKSHLTIGEYEMGLTPGDELPVFDTEIGKIGMITCYDGYFPEPARILALKGAEIILVSTAGDAGHRMIARAMENGVYVAVSCVCNTHVPGVMPTKIINPQGIVLSQTETDGTWAAAEVDLNERKYIYWLSVGAADGEPRDVYAHERITNFYDELKIEMN